MMQIWPSSIFNTRSKVNKPGTQFLFVYAYKYRICILLLLRRTKTELMEQGVLWCIGPLWWSSVFLVWTPKPSGESCSSQSAYQFTAGCFILCQFSFLSVSHMCLSAASRIFNLPPMLSLSFCLCWILICCPSSGEASLKALSKWPLLVITYFSGIQIHIHMQNLTRKQMSDTHTLFSVPFKRLIALCCAEQDYIRGELLLHWHKLLPHI